MGLLDDELLGTFWMLTLDCEAYSQILTSLYLCTSLDDKKITEHICWVSWMTNYWTHLDCEAYAQILTSLNLCTYIEGQEYKRYVQKINLESVVLSYCLKERYFMQLS